MLQSIQKLVEKTGALFEAHPVSCGFAAGLCVAFAVLLIFFLIFLILRSGRLRFLEIPSEDGTLRLDARAVQDAVRAVAEKFPAFSVRRVDICGTQADVRLAVVVDFLGDENGGAVVSLSSVASGFRAATGQMMTEMLGMRKPARVDLEIQHSLAKYSPAESKGSEGGSESSGPEPGPGGGKPQSA